jgi:hypothetical protein
MFRRDPGNALRANPLASIVFALGAAMAARAVWRLAPMA